MGTPSFPQSWRPRMTASVTMNDYSALKPALSISLLHTPMPPANASGPSESTFLEARFALL